MCERCLLEGEPVGDGTAWSWGDALADAAEGRTPHRTLRRGLREWGRGAVSRIEVRQGVLSATVAGGFSTRLLVDPLSAGKQRAVLSLLAADRRWLDACLDGDPGALLLLADAATTRGIHLGPGGDDLAVACTCGSDGDLCWHAVAFLQALAEEVDDDLRVWLSARGLEPAVLARALPDPAPPAPVPPAPVPERLQDRVEDFWTGTGEPRPLPPSRPRVPLDERGDDALRAVFRPEFAVRGRNRAAVERHVDAAVEALRGMYADLAAGGPPPP